jgi:hypothetical protein
MEKSAIKLGSEYGFRERPNLPARAGIPLQRVRVLENVRKNKWKAQWIEPNTGLVDYVESRQLVVPWKQRYAFLREEAAAQRLREHNQRCGYEENSPITDAVEQVLASAGGGVSFYKGVLAGSSDALARFKVRIGRNPEKQSHVAYVDRAGKLHLPFDESLELAKLFAAKEPSAVLVEVEATERQWASEATRPGGQYIVSLLNEYRASWAIIRQWTGHDPAVAAREATIERLTRLVWDAIYALQKAKLNHESERLCRALERG